MHCNVGIISDCEWSVELKIALLFPLGQKKVISFQNNSERQGPTDVLNLGRCLSLLDEFLKNYEDVKQFTGKEDDYKTLLRLVARKRCRSDAGKDTVEELYERLLKESERFV